jgi:hypothetical protein
MRLLIVWICYLLLPLGLYAQSTPPPKGYRLHRVRRLRPAPLPAGGLLPFRGAATGTWGLADSTGQRYVRAEFSEPFALPTAPFLRMRLVDFERHKKGSGFILWCRGHEVWVNARGEYLLAPIGTTAYQQPDGSLCARRISRHLTEPQYWYQQEWAGQADSLDLREQWHNKQRRNVKAKGTRVYPVEYLGHGLYAVEGPFLRWHYRWRTLSLRVRQRLWDSPFYQVVPGMIPVALFAENGRRLTPYRYRKLEVSDGGVIYESKHSNRTKTEGYLSYRGRKLLGPYVEAGAFEQNRAVVALPGPDWQHPLYTLIDTTGTQLLPPMPGRLTLPDEAGLLRHEVEQQGSTRWECLTLSGQPAFPGRYFRRAEPFWSDSTTVIDATGQEGILRRDGSWQPTP